MLFPFLQCLVHAFSALGSISTARIALPMHALEHLSTVAHNGNDKSENTLFSPLPAQFREEYIKPFN
ncbi:MAG TPA: hypothetical protein DCP92_24675, partial [Nitrospiraceae bacterium]|nr:hypothetical protein [Nitrospiraceae bacterium]